MGVNGMQGTSYSGTYLHRATLKYLLWAFGKKNVNYFISQLDPEKHTKTKFNINQTYTPPAREHHSPSSHGDTHPRPCLPTPQETCHPPHATINDTPDYNVFQDPQHFGFVLNMQAAAAGGQISGGWRS